MSASPYRRRELIVIALNVMPGNGYLLDKGCMSGELDGCLA